MYVLYVAFKTIRATTIPSPLDVYSGASNRTACQQQAVLNTMSLVDGLLGSETRWRIFQEKVMSAASTGIRNSLKAAKSLYRQVGK